MSHQSFWFFVSKIQKSLLSVVQQHIQWMTSKFQTQSSVLKHAVRLHTDRHPDTALLSRNQFQELKVFQMSNCVGSVSGVLLLTSSFACWACEVMVRAKRSGSWLSFCVSVFLFLIRMSAGFLSSVYSSSQRTRTLPPTEHPVKQKTGTVILLDLNVCFGSDICYYYLCYC